MNKLSSLLVIILLHFAISYNEKLLYESEANPIEKLVCDFTLTFFYVSIIYILNFCLLI